MRSNADAPESTTFADAKAHLHRTRAAGGLKGATFSLAGFVDTSYPAQELARFESLGTEKSVMVVPDGEDPGDVAYVIPVAVTAHSPLQGSIGDLAAFAYAAEGDGRVVRAQVFDVREGVTADNVTARVNLGPIARGRDSGSLGTRNPESRASTDFRRKRGESDDRHGHYQGRRRRDQHHAVGEVFHSWACHGRMVATAVRLFCRQP